MSNLPYFSGVLYFGAASTLFAFGARGRALAGESLYYLAFSVVWLTIITLLNIRGVNVGKWLNNVSSLGSLLPLIALIAAGGRVVCALRSGDPLHCRSADSALDAEQRGLLVDASSLRSAESRPDRRWATKSRTRGA